MRAFVWEQIDGVSNNYHSGGGLMVIAKDLKAARKLLRDPHPDYYIPLDCKAFEIQPDFRLEAPGQDPQVVVFPDAGCC